MTCRGRADARRACPDSSSRSASMGSVVSCGTIRGAPFPILPRLAYASCYVYSPAGDGNASTRARLLRTMLKDGDARFLAKYADRVRREVLDAAPLAGFLGRDQILVPVPGSAPPRHGAASVAERLARALIVAGLGCDVWPVLLRHSAVPKSATAALGSRPTVAMHLASFAVDAHRDPPPAQIVLIDDVVTKGRTLLAAASRLRAAYPTLEIRAFAMLRTLGFVDGVQCLLAPCLGEIRWRAGDAWRNP